MEENNLVRCFICIDLPREIVNEVERVQEELRKKNLFHGKFTEGENLHLTLKFLSEISEERVEEVKKKLKEIKFSKFGAFLGELGVFSSGYIRIVWAKILGKRVEELQVVVDEKLSGLFPKEERFMSHLTIARVKNVKVKTGGFSKNSFLYKKNKDKKLLLDALKEIKVQNLGFEVKEFFLMKSVLEESGPVYSVIEKFELS